jgi:hypothetical protein
LNKIKVHLLPAGLAERPRRGYFCAMSQEPSTKPKMAFFDGQNLFHHAKDAFEYEYQSFNANKLSLLDNIAVAPGGTFNFLFISSHFDNFETYI